MQVIKNRKGRYDCERKKLKNESIVIFNYVLFTWHTRKEIRNSFIQTCLVLYNCYLYRCNFGLKLILNLIILFY